MNEELENFEEFDEGEYFDEITADTINSFIKSASKSATKLTKLIVENNRHNSEKMTSEDIYKIYEESFEVAMSTIAKYGMVE